MIRTLLLDDEPLILRTMQTAIERCNPEYRIVGTAADGKTGLDLVERLQPDVIFTDIRMPVMDGLELVETMRSRGIHTLAVIVSGYTDFDYAQRAIAQGVTDYLVKPWKADQLRRVLDRVQAEVERRAHAEIREQLQKAMSADPGEKECARWERLRNGSRFLLIHLCFGPLISSRMTEASHKDAARTENPHPIPTLGGESWGFPGRFPNEMKVILRLKAAENPAETIKAYYERLCDLTDGLSYVTMVSSDSFESIREFSRLNEKTEETIARSIRFAANSLILFGQVLPEELPDPAELEDKMTTLRDAMQKPRQEELARIAGEIFAVCEGKRYTQLQLQAVVRRMLRRVPAMQDRDIADSASMLVISCDSYAELPEAFVAWLNQKTTLFDSKEGKSVEDILEELRGYIHDHLQERLMIQELAARYGINYSYLSAVFRRRYGISLNEYINGERIRRAAKLMKSQRDWKFKDIAEMVGFTDPYYFSRVFKVVLGVSPTQYKKMMEE